MREAQAQRFRHAGTWRRAWTGAWPGARQTGPLCGRGRPRVYLAHEDIVLRFQLVGLLQGKGVHDLPGKGTRVRRRAPPHPHRRVPARAEVAHGQRARRREHVAAEAPVPAVLLQGSWHGSCAVQRVLTDTPGRARACSCKGVGRCTTCHGIPRPHLDLEFQHTPKPDADIVIDLLGALDVGALEVDLDHVLQPLVIDVP